MTDRPTTCGSACTCAPTPAVDPVDEGRRGFLGSLGAASAMTVLAPGVTLLAFGGEATAAPGASAAKRWGLLIDVSKCTEGCSDCVSACSTEHGWKTTGHPATDPQWIRKVNLRDPKSGAIRSLPVMCQHCAQPPCADVCPTGASFKRADGIVLVDRHRCIGCRYCMMACPYKARSFVHEPVEDQKTHTPRGMGTVEGCNLCVHRVDRGGVPACVEACGKRTGAMLFGDLADPASEIAKTVATFASSQIRADLGVDPGVRYRNL